MKNCNYCQRCKNMKVSLFECSKCEIKICKKCLKTVYPNIEIDNNDSNENILSEHCYYGCDKNIKYCNDCGNNVDGIKPCQGCYTPLCNSCKINNYRKQMKERNFHLSESEKCKLVNYCSISCYIIHTNYSRELINNCSNCHLLFINPFKYKYCNSCRIESMVENNITKNKERKELQNKVKYLFKKGDINIKHLENYVKNNINNHIKKYKTIYENKITFEQWLNDTDSGNHTCMNLWDKYVRNYF